MAMFYFKVSQNQQDAIHHLKNSEEGRKLPEAVRDLLIVFINAVELDGHNIKVEAEGSMPEGIFLDAHCRIGAGRTDRAQNSFTPGDLFDERLPTKLPLTQVMDVDQIARSGGR